MKKSPIHLLKEHFYIDLASLLKGEKTLVQNFYIAMGMGAPAWDQIPPEYQRDTRRLVNEIARRAVPLGEVAFLDSEGKATEVPTPRLRIHAAFGFDEGVGTWRECGLFAGEATAEKDSGTLISYYVHPRDRKNGGDDAGEKSADRSDPQALYAGKESDPLPGELRLRGVS